MRIAYVCPRYPPQIGGVETHVSSLATRVADRGHDVDVLTLADDSTESVTDGGGVTVRRFPIGPLGGHFGPPRALRRYMREHAGSWDLVHAHGHGSPPALAAALASTAPLVFTPHFHGMRRSLAGRAYGTLIRSQASAVLRRAARIICVSEAEADALVGRFPRTAGRIVVIPNGTSRSPVPPRSDGPCAPQILSLGRLVEYKHVDEVIAALPHLPDDVTLQVVGDGPARPSLEDRAEREGLTQRVRFLGHVDDDRVDRALSESRVLVTMSGLEAFGLAPLDAVAAGLPVVASDIPAHREMLQHFGAERMTLVPLGASPAELATAIERAAATGPHEPPADLPTWDRVADLVLGVYGGVLDGDGAP
jgi:1,2-diacylglycerol 3-alpha-glucosyltransferase